MEKAVMTSEYLLTITRDTIEIVKYYFLITLSESGQANARLVQHFKPETDMTIWFCTSSKSRKVREIGNKSHITREKAMKKVTGLALVSISLLHSLIGLIAPGLIGFEGIWQDIANSGVIDAAKPDALHIWGYYWFLISGFFLILFGCLCHWIENQLNLPLPSFVGWGLLVIACFGIVLDVDTGFWLVLLVALNAIAVSRFRYQPT